MSAGRDRRPSPDGLFQSHPRRRIRLSNWYSNSQKWYFTTRIIILVNCRSETIDILLHKKSSSHAKHSHRREGQEWACARWWPRSPRCRRRSKNPPGRRMKKRWNPILAWVDLITTKTFEWKRAKKFGYKDEEMQQHYPVLLLHYMQQQQPQQLHLQPLSKLFWVIVLF